MPPHLLIPPCHFPAPTLPSCAPPAAATSSWAAWCSPPAPVSWPSHGCSCAGGVDLLFAPESPPLQRMLVSACSPGARQHLDHTRARPSALLLTPPTPDLGLSFPVCRPVPGAALRLPGRLPRPPDRQGGWPAACHAAFIGHAIHQSGGGYGGAALHLACPCSTSGCWPLTALPPAHLPPHRPTLAPSPRPTSRWCCSALCWPPMPPWATRPPWVRG